MIPGDKVIIKCQIKEIVQTRVGMIYVVEPLDKESHPHLQWQRMEILPDHVVEENIFTCHDCGRHFPTADLRRWTNWAAKKADEVQYDLCRECHGLRLVPGVPGEGRE